jgi:outer membrane protein assembly factor BamB
MIAWVVALACVGATPEQATGRLPSAPLRNERSALDGGWPQFRGPNGSGVYTGPPLPATLSRATSLGWEKAVPFGRSSPVVRGDRVYLTGAEGDRLLTLCLDRRDGRLIWRHESTRSRVDERVDRLNDPASPTPAVDASGVYVFFPDAGLLALDLDGRERWRVPLGPFKSAFGMASSPIVADGLLIQACDQQTGSFLIAVDTRTGKTRWRLDRPDMRQGWYTPAVSQSESSGSGTLIVPGSARIEGFELVTGRRMWAVAGSGAENLGVPLVGDGRVYVTVRGFSTPAFVPWASVVAEYDKDGNGRLSRAEVRAHPVYFEQFNHADTNRDGEFSEEEWTDMRNVGLENFGLTALALDGASVDTPRVLWRVEKNLPYVPAPVLYKGIIYMVKSSGIITAVDASSGDVLKEARATGALGPYFASPVAGDDKVFLASEDGHVTVLRAGPELRILEVSDLGEEIYGTPALVGGAVYIRTRTRLYCFRTPG